MNALPAIAGNSTGAESDEASALATSDRDITRMIALMLEGLLTESEFMALTGIDAQTVPQRVADTEALAEVQRTAMQMRNSGQLARLEANRHARAAVEIAAEIMANPDAYPAHRLAAATFIARAAGTEKPPSENEKKGDTFKINIILGPEPEHCTTIECTAIEAKPVTQGVATDE